MSALLPEALLERVLTKLGIPHRPEPTPRALALLYAAWCEKVPFDNVLKLIHAAASFPGPLPGNDAVDFFQCWLRWGTGGTCWAGNGALQALLATLGFPARRGVGTMLVAPNVPPNHGTVVVDFGEALYLVDASMLHGEPLPVEKKRPTAIAHRAWGISCTSRDGRWHILWRPLHMPRGMDCSVYRLEELDAPSTRFEELHERTRAWSPFNFQLYVRQNRGAAVVGVACGRRVVFEPTGAVMHTPLDAEGRLRVLVEELGMSESVLRRLPPDRPTPPPPGSHTARRLAAQEIAAVA